MTGKIWAAQEIQIVKENYKNLSKEGLLNILNPRTWNAIQLKGERIGIKRMDLWFKEEKHKYIFDF